jgi:hypothetical protein
VNASVFVWASEGGRKGDEKGRDEMRKTKKGGKERR